MNELRWQPLLRQWVAVATARQDRPQMPADWCPFCPGSGRVPDNYDVLLYPNDFPAFSEDNPPFDPTPGLFKTTGARGACDVVLYSPSHTTWPSQLPVAQWRKVVGLWQQRTGELFAIPDVQYVMAFENTGEAIGVTMPHPHGQIYAFPFYPPLVETEFNSASEYFGQHQRCLYCELLERELADGERIVDQNESFVAYVPFAARFPSEVSIYPRRHFANLLEIQDKEAEGLASLISVVRQKYDNMYGFLGRPEGPLPLMMVVRQGPAKTASPWFHFHIEFLPIQRSATKLKYMASVESAAGTFLADTRPEAQAAKLRESAPATK